MKLHSSIRDSVKVASLTHYEILHTQSRFSTTCLRAYRIQTTISLKILSA
ncbi:unnamed protein product [Hymenolepis diminuta]|uniref:Uncharacterized protein n=1 Tax=Hymenolepis diminuta TaxID=6216 RepID=A0A564Z4F1_HYMDI|nr:unnamed protein product [Hymenolepis diminuta]